MGSKITIVGAGITGPAAAMTLARAGHDVTVYEQRAPDELFSAGIVGVTPGNWSALQLRSVDLQRYALSQVNAFRDYATGMRDVSPFRYITWTGLHQSLTDAAMAAGARFVWQTRVDTAKLEADYVMDAGGIFTASKYLASEYTGYEIFRGLSAVNVADDFVTLTGMPGAGYFTVGRTPEGAAWALFAPRPRPAHLSTVNTSTHPHEFRYLPAEYRRVVMATDTMIVSPMSDWVVPDHFHDATFTRFAMGDATGPVRPITTSGANLAVMAGMHAGELVTGNRAQIHALETSLLRRRAFDMIMGRQLEGPEIGGDLEDDRYYQHHAMLFGAGER